MCHPSYHLIILRFVKNLPYDTYIVPKIAFRLYTVCGWTIQMDIITPGKNLPVCLFLVNVRFRHCAVELSIHQLPAICIQEP